MDLGLRERVVLVTGGSRGIGRACALSFAREGARVALTYRSDRDRAEAVRGEIEAAGGDAIALPLDLSSAATIHAAAASARERWGRIDVLVNNAVEWGSRLPYDMPPFESIAIDEWTGLFRANSEGAYTAIQAVLPAMRERTFGRIVNVSSGIAVDGMAGAGPYAAAKAALHGLTRTLSKELGPAGILVNVVMPGFTLTEKNLERIPPAIRQRVADGSPIRRILPPEEVVPTIVFLGSALNTAVTGEIVRASGGIA
jgi:3-oxoacyl-[acyl-carrier protein] reductase